jgi:hypothetical protein
MRFKLRKRPYPVKHHEACRVPLVQPIGGPLMFDGAQDGDVGTLPRGNPRDPGYRRLWYTRE